MTVKVQLSKFQSCSRFLTANFLEILFWMSFFSVCRFFWYVVYFGMSFFLVCRFFWYFVFFWYVVFFGMLFFLACRFFWYVVFFGMSFFLVCRFFWYVVFFGTLFFLYSFFCFRWINKERTDRHCFSLPLSLRGSTPCKKWNYQRSLKTENSSVIEEYILGLWIWQCKYTQLNRKNIMVFIKEGTCSDVRQYSAHLS